MKKNVIYKYLTCENAIETIKTKCVCFNNPLNYNDPFDSIIDISEKEKKRSYDLLVEVNFLKMIFEEILKKDIKLNILQSILIWYAKSMYKITIYFVRKIKRYYSNWFLKYIFNKIYNVCKSIDSDSILYETEQYSNEMWKMIEEIRNKLIVSCFSKKNDSILMWGHYANKHTGVCLEFERPKQAFYDVCYKKKRMCFDLYEITSFVAAYFLIGEKVPTDNKIIFNKIKKPLLTKAINWSYEEEVRCFYPADENPKVVKKVNGISLLKMPTPITGIYLGCKIKLEDKEKIVELAKKENIPIYQFVESNNKYELIIKK